MFNNHIFYGAIFGLFYGHGRNYLNVFNCEGHLKYLNDI